ncbi:pecanex-like protein 4 [Dendronephthya gigantea]|uniref:pecanex-like protein 4 n=1 Tax=Dendronephthya gigantea TaxID=151771 RepID=UPI00106D5CE0|nr:pecanex-like protein 4 [Dendronephthya gigantea]
MASGQLEGAKAPFLNDYKLQFLQKRFPRTLTGGLRLKIGAPLYVYLYQILVFLWPALLGGIFTVLTEFDVLQDYVCCYLFGGILGLIATCIYLLRMYLSKNLYAKGSQSSRHNVLADDDQVDFSSCCGVDTFLYIFPAKAAFALLHGIVLAVLCSMVFLCLLPSRLQNLGYDTATTVVLLIFNWLTLCIASHSLIIEPPPETAIFRSLDTVGLNAFMRPFYVTAIAVVGVLARHYSSLEEISKVLYIVMAILPLLWTVGLLPPIDALFPWLGEQILVFALGGTYMASDSRLFFALLVSVISLVPAYFITNYTALMTYSAAIGFILSLDMFHITSFVVNNKTHKLHLSTIITIGKYSILLVITGTVAGITSHLHEDATETMFDSFGYVFVMLLLLLKVLGDLQYVYVCSGLTRNPFFINSATSVEKLKKFQQKIGYLGHIYNVLLSYICPFIMVAFLGTFLKSSKDLGSFATALGTIRALRWVWQNTFKSLLEVTVCCVIYWIDIGSSWWNDLGLGLQLMVIGIMTDRLHELITKIKFMFTLFITSWTEAKQRHSATLPTLITSLLFFPLVLSIVVISVALSAPLTPIFCFPIFFVGFPRPKRMWPSLTAQSSTGSEGCVFYQQLVPKICSELQSTIASGNLVTKSDYLMVRYQDRLIVLHILEKGYRYCTLIARGLELQETSCHTVEAARVDDIFEDVFTKETKTPFGLNSYPLHTLTPLNCLVVETYSDAHNVLTGIIDQPENIERQSSNFIKCLVWVLLKELSRNERSSKDTVENPVASVEKPEVMDSSDVVNLQEDNMVVQNKETTLYEDFHSENVKLALTKDKKSSKPSKILLDTDWSDKEWSASESSEDEDQDKTKPLPSSGENPLVMFGLPAQDIGSQTRLNDSNPQKSGSVFPSRKITPIAMETRVEDAPWGGGGSAGEGSGQLSSWKNLLQPCSRYQAQVHSEFPEEWFRFVISRIINTGNETDAKNLDEVKTSMFRDLIMYCYAVINVCGLHGSVVEAGPSRITKVFQDRIPWSPELDLLEEDSELKEIVLRAYRYAFKLTYDEAVLGPFDDHDELRETLNDYDENWFIGVENKPGWNEAILEEKSNLFTIGYDTDQGTYTSHLLTKQELALYTGTLNSEAVNGQWSSLAFELLYLTNDDEERYSIQAHPVLLRNLTMQAADPPLGYAVYSSGPVHLSYGLI